MSTGLAHIQEDQLDEQLFSQICSTWGVAGILTVEYCYDFSAPSVSVAVKLLGATLGTCSINTSNPQCTVGGSVAGFKAEVSIQVDFNQSIIVLTAELCAPNVGRKDYSTTVHL